ncbi:hypothetical protein FXO38_18228 [Capsicum annuum]|nr:hypothetical protein FXO38_18228 [Capsicum annuum]KAF3651092.1 hypothetical protein FXO37_18175 [Capsicum annuum]
MHNLPKLKLFASDLRMLSANYIQKGYSQLLSLLKFSLSQVHNGLDFIISIALSIALGCVATCKEVPSFQNDDILNGCELSLSYLAEAKSIILPIVSIAPSKFPNMSFILEAENFLARVNSSTHPRAMLKAIEMMKEGLRKTEVENPKELEITFLNVVNREHRMIGNKEF